MIKFRCTSCQKKIGVKDEYAGRAIRCPGCETRLTVPQPEPEPLATAEPDGLGDLAGLAALEAAAPSQLQSVEAPGRTCPSCGAALSDKAVLCIECGYSFQKGGKQIDTTIAVGEEASSRPTTVGGTGRMVLGLSAATGVAIACGVLWLILMAVTGYEVGILAWIIGGLIGLTAGVIGRNPSPVYCGLTACVAGGSILGAKLVVAAFLSLAVWGIGLAEDWGPEGFAVHHAVMEQMADEGAFTGMEAAYAAETVGYFFGDDNVQEVTVDTDRQWNAYSAAWDSVEAQVVSRVETLTDAERQQLLVDADARHANWDLSMIEEGDAELEAAKADLEAEGVSDSFGANFLLTFGLLDIVFFGLAVTTAYSVAYKQGA